MGLLAGLLKRATPENPKFSLSDPAAWDALTDGEPSGSGIRVNRDKALTYSPWWRGVSMISRDVGKIPLYTYRRNGEGKDRAKDHPAYFLLRRKPNEFQTAMILRQQLTGHALSTGNGYAYIFRDGSANPIELVPLDPDTTFPYREAGQVGYITSTKGEQRKLPAEDVLHIKGFGFDGLEGYSVVKKARESLGLGMGAERYQTKFFSNAARPSAVIEVPGRLSPEAIKNLREGWERMQQGIDNAHRTAILDGGSKLNAFSWNAADSQLMQSRQFQIREVSNWIGVPPHKLGDTTRTAYASLEQENQSYLDDALDYWLCNWEEECWDKLLTEEEKRDDSIVVEFMRQALVRADLTARANYYRQSLGGRPWMRQNEVRGLENLNPVDGGDEILEPLNMTAPGGKDEPAAAGEGESADPATSAGDAAASGDVQATALNGAQIDSLVNITAMVGDGSLTKPAAKVLIKVSFPLMAEADINALVDAIEVSEPAPTPTDPPPGQEPPPDDEGDDDGGSPPPAGRSKPKPAPKPRRQAPPTPPPDNTDFRESTRALLLDAVRRVTRRIAHQAERASQEPRKWLEFIEAIHHENYLTVRGIVDATEATCAAAFNRAADPHALTDWLLKATADEYRAIADTATPKTLADDVPMAASAIEGRLVNAAAAKFLQR